VVKRLVMAGTFVSLGHSGATAAQAAEAFGWGASHVTHLFNAMSGLHHRSPGLAAAALADDRVTVGLIADGVHVAPTMLRLAWRALGPTRIALVTDAMAAMGMGDGSYRIGSVPVEVRGEVRNAEGNLAGSAATMDQLMRTMMRATGCSLEEAVVMASATPAEVVGHVPERGDRVLLDTDLQVVAVSVGGKVVHGEVAE
jgi:N-acetylglucosamine-6-phosphate deacetylase